jgi:hypothetical protein
VTDLPAAKIKDIDVELPWSPVPAEPPPPSLALNALQRPQQLGQAKR